MNPEIELESYVYREAQCVRCYPLRFAPCDSFLSQTRSSSAFCLPKRPEGLMINVMMMARKATTI